MHARKSLQCLGAQLYYSGVDYYKGLRNPRWLLMRKIAQFKTVRTIVTHLAQARHMPPQVVADARSLFDELRVDEAVHSLHRNGIYLGLRLPGEVVDEILDFAHAAPCYGNRDRRYGFNYADQQTAQATYGKHFRVASYFNTARECPAIAKIESDPKLLEIAGRYLCGEHVHQGNQLWWSFADQALDDGPPRKSQMFHYDLDDYRFLKFFFYLTDVDSSSGPHVCVRGSHDRKKISHRFLRRPRQDHEIVDYYGADALMTVEGKAGFGFVEDAFCFHKGAVPTGSDRLLLAVEFSMRDYGMQGDLVA